MITGIWIIVYYVIIPVTKFYHGFCKLRNNSVILGVYGSVILGVYGSVILGVYGSVILGE